MLVGCSEISPCVIVKHVQHIGIIGHIGLFQELLQGNFFRNEEISREEPINFHKFYDSEGVTQLPLRSDHFINPAILLIT